MSQMNFFDNQCILWKPSLLQLSIYYTLKLLYNFYLKVMVFTKWCLPAQYFWHSTSQKYPRIHFSLSMSLLHACTYISTGIPITISNVFKHVQTNVKYTAKNAYNKRSNRFMGTINMSGWAVRSAHRSYWCLLNANINMSCGKISKISIFSPLLILMIALSKHQYEQWVDLTTQPLNRSY